MTASTAPAIIYKLIETFEQNLDAYRSSKNETELRREFLDKFFTALGWDVANEKGYDEAGKEVIHEFSVDVSGQQKKADYAFRVGRGEKFDFLVEAKKPSVKVESSQDAAFQIRRYGWSAKLPINILTDFEHFAVYDCRAKPSYNDKASMGRTMLVHYKEYAERWDEIASVFSPEAVRKGSFTKYTEGLKGKKGTADVDDAFLQEIERWRELLAKNIALRNDDIDIPGLNYSVQMIIDRIVFLRICEERGIEPENQLQEIASGDGIYPELCDLFKRADTKYNSGLFHFKQEKEIVSRPDDLTLGLDIDDKVLRDIISNLYYPKSPYAFLYIPSDILGQVYERFLGKVIRLTAGHQAKVEEKPEVRKAGGVYYTPTYIVEYIVINTLGKLLIGLTPKEAAKLKIVDPACGSGTFLLGAFEYLLAWHLKWYSENDPEKWVKDKALVKVENDYRLTTSKKKEILLNNIYGVDIDAQAVEVTKLSLLLKVLENASGQLELGMERILPDLGNNIKCGNSLIGFDYFEGQLFPDDEERARVNPFDWQREFPEVFAKGGFDVVIGNPPYVRQEELIASKNYFQSHYKTYIPTADLYVSFIEKELGLLKNSGLFGMIVSNKWLRAAYGEPLRKFLVSDVTLTQVIDLAGLPVFEGATVRTIILLCSPVPDKQKSFKYLAPLPIDDFRKIQSGVDLHVEFEKKSIELKISDLKSEGWAFSNVKSADLLSKLTSKNIPITQYINGKLYFGIKTGLNKAFVIDRQTRDELIRKNPQSKEIIKPLLVGKNVRRYSADFAENYLIWTYIGVSIQKHPAVFEHLKQFQAELENRWDKGEHWWELRACDYYDKFATSKIIYPDIATSCRFYLDADGYFGTNTTYFIPSDDKYLLGILNSKLAQFFFTQVCAGLEGTGTIYLRFFGQYIQNFPVRSLDINESAEKAQHDKMVALVEQILALHKSLAGAKSPSEKERLERQIEVTDRGIDTLVYELYGLSEEEIKIVEGKK
jgi:hypothetical protein